MSAIDAMDGSLPEASRCRFLAYSVAKLEIGDDQYFLQKPTSPRIATKLPLYVTQNFAQRNIDLMAPPPAKFLKCSSMPRKFLNQLQNKSFATESG